MSESCEEMVLGLARTIFDHQIGISPSHRQAAYLCF